MCACRCSRCGARRTMRFPDTYKRPPRCRCGSRKWRVDWYRMTHEIGPEAPRPCRDHRCYYGFPHRAGSKWCIQNPKWDAEDAEKEFGGELVEGTDEAWRYDPLCFGQRPTTSEEPPF